MVSPVSSLSDEAPFPRASVEPTAGWARLAPATCSWCSESIGCEQVLTEQHLMTLIRTNSGIITQINVFTVPPDGQQPLIDHLTKAADYARQEPGWLSASLHRSLDGTRVVNYAQSQSVDAAKAVIERLKAGGFLERNREFGEAHPGLYEVVATIER